MSWTRIAVAAALAVSCSPVGALNLTGLIMPNPAVAVNDPCPEHSGYRCVASARRAQLLSTGPNAAFTAAWNTVLPREWDPALWTLSWCTEPLGATLNLTTYRAFNYGPTDPEYGSYYAGAEIRIEWTPETNQEDLRWIQAIHSNRPRYQTTDYYLDISTLRPPEDQPPVYPYSYADHHFYDKPSRWCEPDQHIFWEAYLYLARVDRKARSVVMYEGVLWGYTVDCLVPEPASWVILFTGGGTCLGFLALKRR
ncbi:MAG: PEP-CTERM sorting domain-containing protein [Armatimonadota bacterium]